MDAASVVMKRGAKTPDRRNETTGTYVTYAGGGSKKTCERQDTSSSFICLFKHRRQRAEATYMPVKSIQ